jgi:hypothetical protein
MHFPFHPLWLDHFTKSTSHEASHYAVFSNILSLHSPSFQILSSACSQISWVCVFHVMSETKFRSNTKIFFLDFPIYLQSVTIHSDTFSKWCDGKRGRVEECSVAPLRNKRVKTLCGCREQRHKLRKNIN